jgi:transcriptional regulator with XRE-family HTH domain
VVAGAPEEGAAAVTDDRISLENRIVAELRHAVRDHEKATGRPANVRGLARAANISRSSLYTYLNGTTIPDAAKMDAILTALTCDDAVRARLNDLYDQLADRTIAARSASEPARALRRGPNLVVEREAAGLSYADGYYSVRVTRLLHNDGDEPITQHRVRVVVDRYPDNPPRSNRHHRQHPLTWDELGLLAFCDGVLMHWRPVVDRDAEKVIALLFENDERHFPLYPGEHAEIQYAYRVSSEKWGRWFTRSTTRPTLRLDIVVDLPSALGPKVWGIQNSENGSFPFPTPISATERETTTRFSWWVDNPPLGRQYRVEWCFDQ